jgi:hypothetical protein
MYQWIVFVHIASVLGLLIVHPVPIAFHLKEERVDVRIRELLEVTESASRLRGGAGDPEGIRPAPPEHDRDGGRADGLREGAALRLQARA